MNSVATPLWLYLHLPRLQLDSLYRQEIDQPMAIVCHQHHRLMELNDKAKATGLYIGMGVGSAAALCHNLIAIPDDEQRPKRALHQLANRLYKVTADIALWPPDGLVIRVTPMLKLYQNLEHYWQTIRHTMPPNFFYQYAFADTPHQSRLLARHDGGSSLSELSHRQELSQTLPVTALDVDPHIHQQWQSVGLKTVGDVLSLSESELIRRFPQQVVTYLAQLRGRYPHLLNFYQPPSYFHAELELQYDIDDQQRLLKPIGHLLAQLVEYWQRHNQYSQHIELHLVLKEHEPLNIHIGCAQPTQSSSLWQQLITFKLESIALPAPVSSVRLRCTRLLELQGQSRSLLDRTMPGSPEHLLASLDAKLGTACLQRPNQIDDFRPERRNQLGPFSHSRHGLVPPSIPHAVRPLWLLTQARRLDTTVRLTAEPERVETGWWDNHPIQRDYYPAHDPNGRRLWVYRTPGSEWYVHGIFS